MFLWSGCGALCGNGGLLHGLIGHEIYANFFGFILGADARKPS